MVAAAKAEAQLAQTRMRGAPLPALGGVACGAPPPRPRARPLFPLRGEATARACPLIPSLFCPPLSPFLSPAIKAAAEAGPPPSSRESSPPPFLPPLYPPASTINGDSDGGGILTPAFLLPHCERSSRESPGAAWTPFPSAPSSRNSCSFSRHSARSSSSGRLLLMSIMM